MQKLYTVLLAALLLSGCATVDSLNVTAERFTRQAIEQSELNRCSVHPAPCLTDDQFKAVNVELNKTAVAGREFTKLRIAGKASMADAATFLHTLSSTTASLSMAFTTGAIRTVLDKLAQAQTTVTRLMGKLS